MKARRFVPFFSSAPALALAFGMAAATSAFAQTQPSAQRPDNWMLKEMDRERVNLANALLPQTALITVNMEKNTPHGVQKGIGLGSGFIKSSADCLIVTNHHVIAADGGDVKKITVTFSGDPKHPVDGTVVGFDTQTDVAVVKTKCDKPLPQEWQVTFADSDKLAVGQYIIAIGNPLGLDRTTTYGGLSTIHRVIGEGKFDDLVQIDAPINQGNSGGPSFNMDGEVIGMNTAIMSKSGGSAGLGFAIPSNMVNEVATSIIENSDHKMHYAFLGIVPKILDQDAAHRMGLAQAQGVLLAGVDKDGAAGKAGLKRGDIIVSINGARIEGEVQSDLDRFINHVAMMKAGDPLDITFLRDGQEHHVTATLGTRPEEQIASTSPEDPDEDGQNGPGGLPSGTLHGMSTEELKAVIQQGQQVIVHEQARIEAQKKLLKQFQDELAKRSDAHEPNLAQPPIAPGPRAPQPGFPSMQP